MNTLAKRAMESREGVSPSVVVHVDPSCPFAWITSRWLSEVERCGVIDLEVRLLSLSVVNEHRPLDDWYRAFNDMAWIPARVMAAVDREHGGAAASRFYEAFGQRFHVELDTADDIDRHAVSVGALAAAGLPDGLIQAAEDVGWDDLLRSATKRTLDEVGFDVGVPVVEIDGAMTSGPVLSAANAVSLFEAIRVVVRCSDFVRLERQRTGDLRTD